MRLSALELIFQISDRCRDRKTKCYRSTSSNDCQSCIGAETDCTYSQAGVGDRQSSTTRSTTASCAPQQSRVERRHGNGNTPDDEVKLLQEQVKRLTDCVNDLQNKMQMHATAAPDTNSPQRDRAYTTEKKDSSQPHQPLFVGHTRSQYSLDVAKTSLVEKGLSSDAALQSSIIPSALPSPRAQSPELAVDEAQTGTSDGTGDPLLSFSRTEIARLIGVFQEEVEAIYPFVNGGQLTDRLGEILGRLKDDSHDGTVGRMDQATLGDIRILKTIVAVAVVIEAHGRNDLSKRLIDSSGQNVARITESPSIDMRDLQSLAILVSHTLSSRQKKLGTEHAKLSPLEYLLFS